MRTNMSKGSSKRDQDWSLAATPTGWKRIKKSCCHPLAKRSQHFLPVKLDKTCKKRQSTMNDDQKQRRLLLSALNALRVRQERSETEFRELKHSLSPARISILPPRYIYEKHLDFNRSLVKSEEEESLERHQFDDFTGLIPIITSWLTSHENRRLFFLLINDKEHLSFIWEGENFAATVATAMKGYGEVVIVFRENLLGGYLRFDTFDDCNPFGLNAPIWEVLIVPKPIA